MAAPGSPTERSKGRGGAQGGAVTVALLLVLSVFFSGAYETHEVMGQKFGASRGFGLWLSLLGSLGGAVAGFMTVKGTSPMGDAPKPPAA